MYGWPLDVIMVVIHEDARGTSEGSASRFRFRFDEDKVLSVSVALKKVSFDATCFAAYLGIFGHIAPAVSVMPGLRSSGWYGVAPRFRKHARVSGDHVHRLHRSSPSAAHAAQHSPAVCFALKGPFAVTPTAGSAHTSAFSTAWHSSSSSSRRANKSGSKASATDAETWSRSPRASSENGGARAPPSLAPSSPSRGVLRGFEPPTVRSPASLSSETRSRCRWSAWLDKPSAWLTRSMSRSRFAPSRPASDDSSSPSRSGACLP
mmetsp:Transcript_15917/g.67088  ORF Transcript_15917/g.67088 Transcript_15917/m.67088 type:complete len:263 (-) Transcript_15917:247-1035(-)